MIQADTDDWPPTLVKALTADFDYALGLCDGCILRFRRAHLCTRAGWVHLAGITTFHTDWVDYPLPRGLDVALSAIAWVADAPEGA